MQETNEKEKASAEEDELYGENVFSGWRKNDSLFSDLMGNPFIWGCAAALVLIVLLFALWPKSDSSDTVGRIEALAQRIEMLENRIFILESNFENVSIKPVSNDQPLKAMELRIEQLEAAYNERTEKVNETFQTITTKLSALEKRPATPPPAKSSATKKAEKPKSATAKSTAEFHTVQKGETLYSLGRKYGISVDQLLKINKIDKASPIIPGQELRVTP